MPPWRLADSLEQLRTELNARWPNRDKHSDGTIGDTSHAATASDHNPNPAGVVCAYDIDTDLDGTDDSNDPEMDALVEYFRTHPHPDLKYVIYCGRMFSRYLRAPFGPFEWRPYTGDSHVSHPHVSVGVGRDGQSVPPYDDTDTWLPPVAQLLPPPPSSASSSAQGGPMISLYYPTTTKFADLSRADDFWIGEDGSVRHRFYAGGKWSDEESLDGTVGSISAAWRGDGLQLRLVADGTDDGGKTFTVPYEKVFDVASGQWGEWTRLPGKIRA